MYNTIQKGQEASELYNIEVMSISINTLDIIYYFVQIKLE